MILFGTVNGLILFIGHCDYISLSSNFAFFPQHYLMDLHYTWDRGQLVTANDLIQFIGHCDLYLMVQWFCLISDRLFNGFTSYMGWSISWIL